MRKKSYQPQSNGLTPEPPKVVGRPNLRDENIHKFLAQEGKENKGGDLRAVEKTKGAYKGKMATYNPKTNKWE